MWDQDNTNPKEAIVDWNVKFKTELVGELEEAEARATLGKFMMHNIGFTVYQLTGFILEAYQRIIIKGWMQKNFSLTVAARSLGKSFLCAHFCYLYCLFHPEQHIIIVSATFRSSRRIVENIDAWSKREKKNRYPAGELLRETFDGNMLKKPDMYKITFKNGSTITALPLGDPDNLRGFRCNVLITDETLLIPQNTINLVLKPFLAGAADATAKQRTVKKEDKKIAAGRMKESERKKFKSTSKMINLSSASYKWEELAEMYSNYLSIIRGVEGFKGDETENGVSSYLVHRLSYKVAREELMDPAILREIKERLIPENVIKREYESQFIDESGGYFSAKEMSDCTIPPGQLPCVEIVGDKDAQYVLGIDPNMSSSSASDHFAMCVIKIVTRPKDGKKLGLVVHQYACAGVKLDQHISYLYYVLSRFNIVYIVCDTTQGDNSDFISICNESEYFKVRNIQLNSIVGEFAKDSFDDMVSDVQKSYNPDSSIRRIVQKQYFSSSIIKAANEYLQSCFNQRLILFASHAQSVANQVSHMYELDIGGIHRTHPEFCDVKEDGSTEGTGSMVEFVNYQDLMIELVKRECALIEPKATPLGNLVFDLPAAMRGNRKNETRNRKDSYSALWLANWGLKLLLASKELPPIEDDDLGTPMMFR